MTLPGLTKKVPRGRLVAPAAQGGSSRSSTLVHGTVQNHPLAFYLNLRFIGPPGASDRPFEGGPSLYELTGITDDPTQNRGRGDGNSAFRCDGRPNLGNSAGTVDTIAHTPRSHPQKTTVSRTGDYARSSVSSLLHAQRSMKTKAQQSPITCRCC